MARAAIAVLLLWPLAAAASPHHHRRRKHVDRQASAADRVAMVDRTAPSPPPAAEESRSAPLPSAPPESAVDAPPPRPAFLPSSEPPRDDTVIVEHRRWGLMSGGIVLWAIGYAADAGVTYGFHHDPAGSSLVPLIGPLIQCGEHYGYSGPMVQSGDPNFDRQTNAQINEASTLIATVTYLGLGLDFAGQLAGVIMAITGAATHSSERVHPHAGQVALVPASGGSALAIRF